MTILLAHVTPRAIHSAVGGGGGTVQLGRLVAGVGAVRHGGGRGWRWKDLHF